MKELRATTESAVIKEWQRGNPNGHPKPPSPKVAGNQSVMFIHTVVGKYLARNALKGR